MGKVARHLRVTGRVQGVFFRAWMQDQARKHDLKGWVRNCDDGSVEAHLEGEESLIRWVGDLAYRGPTAARVDRVESKNAELEGFTDFEVRD